jgi:hypothetical protein
MRAWLAKWGFLASLAAFGAAGCQHASTLPSDPLLVSKKPVMAQADVKPPALVAYAEPEVPAGPVEAVAAPQGRAPALTAAHLAVRGQAP